MEKMLKKHYKIIVGVILTIMGVVSLLNAKNDSATFDEIAHIPAGYSYVTRHEVRLNPEHPPLLKSLSAIPLLFLNLKFDTTKPFWTGDMPTGWEAGQWEAGRHLLYEAGNDPNAIVFWSRVPIVLVSLLLGLFLFKWGKELAGILGGLFILTIYAFDPNILGHNHFVTTDVGVAAFLTFAFYYFLKFIKDPSWKNVLFWGIASGLALVVKFSSVTMLPIFGLILIVYPLIRKLPHPESTTRHSRLAMLWSYWARAIVAFLVAMTIVYLVYLFATFKMQQKTVQTIIDYNFSATDSNIKAKTTNLILTNLNSQTITRPLSMYTLGVAWMFKRVSGGNGAYFLGQVGNGFIWYFPVVFLIKETIPLLILALFSLLLTFWQTLKSALTFHSAKETRGKLLHFMRSSVTEYALFGFIVLYSYLSISGKLNIGFRHLFPILPFIYILVTKKVFEFIRKESYKVSHGFVTAVSILLAWQVLTTAFAYPAYTSYFNEAAGGPKNGYHFVTDSNADWGQDLNRLGIWVAKHNAKATNKTACIKSELPGPLGCVKIDKIRVNYFGGGRPNLVLGNKFIDWWDSKRPIEQGWYAISVNQMQGSIYDTKKPENESYRWLNNYSPVAQVGTSILIYYVDTAPGN